MLRPCIGLPGEGGADAAAGAGDQDDFIGRGFVEGRVEGFGQVSWKLGLGMAASKCEEDAVVYCYRVCEDGGGGGAGDCYSRGTSAECGAGRFCVIRSRVAGLERDAGCFWRAGRGADAGVADEDLAEAAVGG